MPVLREHESTTLCQLHTKLGLSQSSLASSITNLPESLNFTGMIIHYEELQMVGWKKEVLITISEGCIETLKVSLWISHEHSLGQLYKTKKDIVGQMIHLQKVRIISFDFTTSNNLQFYGEIPPLQQCEHALFILVTSGSNYSRYKRQEAPFPAHNLLSGKPSDRPICNLYPCNQSDVRIMRKISGVVFTFHHCISKNITFCEEKNPFQQFVNRYLEQESDLHWYRRRLSSRWLRSYEQQEDYYLRTASTPLSTK